MCGAHDQINNGTFQNASGGHSDEGTTDYGETAFEVDCGSFLYCHCLPYSYQDENGEWVEEWVCLADTPGLDYIVPLLQLQGQNCVPVEDC